MGKATLLPWDFAIENFDPVSIKLAGIELAYKKEKWLPGNQIWAIHVRYIRAKVGMDNFIKSLWWSGLDFSTDVRKLRKAYVSEDSGIWVFPIDKWAKEFKRYPCIPDGYIRGIKYLADNKVDYTFLIGPFRDSKVKRVRAVLRLLQQKQINPKTPWNTPSETRVDIL
jgi:hypothetical protein